MPFFLMLSAEQLQMRLPTHVSRVHTQLIRISVSLGSDKLNVTFTYASASQAAFSRVGVLNMWVGGGVCGCGINIQIL